MLTVCPILNPISGDVVVRKPPFVKIRGSGKRAPEVRVFGQGLFGEELGTHEPGKRGRPKSQRQVQRYTQQGSLHFVEKVLYPDAGRKMWSAIAQSLWAAGEKFDIGVASAHAGAAQKPRPNRKKRSLTDVDAPPGGETSAVDVTEISPKK